VSALELPVLSVVVSTEDAAYAGELQSTLPPATELIVVSTEPVGVAGARTVQVFDFEAAYRRNRGLLLARAPVVAFLEDGQLPAPEWTDAVVEAFAARPRPAAALPRRDAALSAGGNVAYDRAELLHARGFPLFTGAPAGSPVPDLLVLLRYEAEGKRRACAPEMRLTRGTTARLRDARRVGRALRLSRKPVLAMRAGASAGRGLRDLAAGALFDRAWPSGTGSVLTTMPDGIRAEVAGGPLGTVGVSHKGKLHFLCRAGDRMIHLYLAPGDHLRDAVAARRTIEERIEKGIPTLHASAESVDSLWLVEDFVSGEPLDRARIHAESDRIGQWIVELGGPPGPRLGDAPKWRTHAEELLAADFPADVRRSLQVLEAVRARHLHGDLRPHNVLARGESFVAVDWENAALEFVPGLDLVFFFLLDEGTPDERVILESEKLAPHLHALGLDAESRPHALRVMLATWALGERRRRARLGVDPGPELFEPLFLRCEQLLRSP
jgi:hypothetical protein